MGNHEKIITTKVVITSYSIHYTKLYEAAGLVDEARCLLPYRHLNALQTVGYRELFRYFDGDISLEQAVADIKTNTRRYAKRQLTWFQRDTSIRWIKPSQFETVCRMVSDTMTGINF